MKTIFLFLLIAVVGRVNAQYTAIPDANFEQELINQEIDTDGVLNGQVLTSDVNMVTNLYVYSNNLYNVIGLEDFTSLQFLDIEQCYNLTELNLTENLNLVSINCRNNNLTYLNISNNILLEGLHCGDNNLTTLDVTNNANLHVIYCQNNHLSGLDVSNNLNISTLYCYNNNITALDVSTNINLVEFHCDYNQITTLNINNSPALLLLTCSHNQLTSLNITNVPQFVRLICGSNSLNDLDINDLPTIKDLSCENNLLTELNLTNNVNLRTLICFNNHINNLNLNNNSLLNVVSFANNNMNIMQIQNGNNGLLFGQFSNGSTPPVYFNRFNATNNPNLHCIFVDDVANCTANWLGVDTTSHFVATQAECDALSNEEFSSNEISVYPNPVKDILYINNKNETIEAIVVYDVLGKKVMEQNNNNAQINISDLKSGFYVVKIKTNSRTTRKKIIKE